MFDAKSIFAYISFQKHGNGSPPNGKKGPRCQGIMCTDNWPTTPGMYISIEFYLTYPVFTKCNLPTLVHYGAYFVECVLEYALGWWANTVAGPRNSKKNIKTSSGPNRPAAAIGGGILGGGLISAILLLVRRLRTSGCCRED